MSKEPKKYWQGGTPINCDVCRKRLKEFFIDGKTIYGPWGILCVECHAKVGAGLGVGRGQKYRLDSLQKVEG